MVERALNYSGNACIKEYLIPAGFCIFILVYALCIY
jgi:hypothetical protein